MCFPYTILQIGDKQSRWEYCINLENNEKIAGVHPLPVDIFLDYCSYSRRDCPTLLQITIYKKPNQT